MLGSTQEIQLFEFGQLGGVLATGTGIYSGGFGAVKFLENSQAVFSGANIVNMDAYTGSYLQGDVILLHFESARLPSGSAILYKD